MENLSDLKHNNQYSLSIRFNSDGFSLYIYDENDFLISTKSIDAPIFKLNENEIKSLLNNEIETQLVFKFTQVICELDKYTIVPLALFVPEECKDYLQFHTESTLNEPVIFNKIYAFDLVNIFSIPKSLQIAVSDIFPTISVNHHLSFLLTDQIKAQSINSVYIFVRSKIMDVVVIQSGDVKLINSFEYRSTEDFTYYTLNIFDQLSLDTENCQVFLIGSTKNSELLKQLQKYLKNCELINQIPKMISSN